MVLEALPLPRVLVALVVLAVQVVQVVPTTLTVLIAPTALITATVLLPPVTLRSLPTLMLVTSRLSSNHFLWTIGCRSVKVKSESCNFFIL